MATGTVLIVAENLHVVLHSPELREMCSMFGYESQLDELGVTVCTIKSVLLDVESKHQELTHGGREYIERLKDAVYDVDDVLDEFNTIIQRQKNIKGGKISKKLRRFFSRSNQLLTAYNMSHEIKNPRSKLDKIAKDHQQFVFSDVYVPLKRRDATFSYASETSVIGREADKDAIVSMLLRGDSESSNAVGYNISFVTIVGVGGLGKTALAQLVYNDHRIQQAFELSLWVCVSDDFNMEKILCQMLGKDVSKIEELQREVRKLIEGKKYLLILDDAWSESRDEWDKVKSFLNLGSKGSKIVVTSRSKKVAKVVGDDMVYELAGLSGEDSWNLFKRLALKQGNEPLSSDDHLFAISHDIVEKCAGVPLSIRVIGSLLYDQDESKWMSLKNANLIKTGQQGEDGIRPILKFSYYHLTSALKSCFSFCAVFPKDFLINKELLIGLWQSQGFLDQIDNGQSEEDVGEEFFSILLHRCFLQDVTEDKYGEIQSCKMHDLIHDLAKEVAGKEMVTLDPDTDQPDHKIRHLSLTADKRYSLVPPVTQFCELTTLRTFLRVSSGSAMLSRSSVSSICLHLRRLRILDLHYSDIESLPDTIGNLLHLRYLDLSRNEKLKTLPNSISKLHNLQVLNLCRTPVRALPRDMRKLVNLRHLYLSRCSRLTHMPAGLDSLTRLRTLTLFRVGNETSNRGDVGKLRDLKALVNLRGELEIRFDGCDVASYNEVEILRTAHLTKMKVSFSDHESIHDETLMGALQPHSSKLKEIVILRYKGIKFPTWAESLTASLPHLVRIHLEQFDRLEILPSLSQLRHLKYLSLTGMPKVEYLESDVGLGPGDQLVFFPSLENLTLNRFPALKGWWKEEISRVIGASSTAIPSFPHLYELNIFNCPVLITLPSCPSLMSLRLKRFNEALTFLAPLSNLSSSIPMSYSVTTDNVEALECLFGEWLGSIYHLRISSFEGESLSGVSEKYVRHASSIKHMNICSCPNLRSLSGGGLEHLTGLQTLAISHSKNLELENNEQQVMPWKSLYFLSSLTLMELPKLLNLPKDFRYLTCLQTLWISGCRNLDLEIDEDEMMPWKSLHCLSSLTLTTLPRLLNLPKGFQHLTSLQTLKIGCDNLEALPEWLNCLSSLKTLSLDSCYKLKSLPESIGSMPSLTDLMINDCENLNKRCREPDGEDCHKVRHIRLDLL